MKNTKTGNFTKELLVDIVYDLVGCLIYSIGVQSLSAPFDLPPGGATGIAMIINHLTDLPISILSLMINIPLLVFAVRKLGKRFAFSSIKTVMILTLTLELANQLVPAYDGDVILAAIFGGVLQGVGLAIVFIRGSTTGGTDILSKLIQLKFPHISIGRLIFAIDAMVLVVTAIVYKSLANAMYAMITVFVCTQVIDSIIYGLDKGRMLMVISEKQDEIIAEISEELGRGSTLLQGTGTYTKEDRPVLLCAVSITEFYKVKRIIYDCDPLAFVVSLETDEVLGEGFKPLDN